MICQTRITNTKVSTESTEEKPYRRYKLAGDKRVDSRIDSRNKSVLRPVGRRDKREPKKASPVVSTESVVETSM
jgi:hypothetical protein